MRNKKGFLNLNNKGFAITSIIYSMLLLFIILMTLTILTLGRKKVLLDKTKNETLGFFAQLKDYPCTVTTKSSIGIEIGIGDVITCKTESFFVVSNDGTNIEMLAKYNLNVGNNMIAGDTEGIQSVKAIGSIKSEKNATLAFSNTNYWSGSSSYPTFVYNNNSSLYQYVEDYAAYLRKILELPELIAGLIDYSKLMSLGCTQNSCSSAPSWVYLTSYWTGTAIDSQHIKYVYNNGNTTSGDTYSFSSNYGVRPMVTIPTNKVRNPISNIENPTITIPAEGYTGVKAIVYLDPTNLNRKCTESDVNSDRDTKTGCMKWYAYAEDSTTYTMILDHNTTSTWSVDNINSLTNRLANDTVEWDDSLNPRLIEVDEIVTIVGKTDWNSSTATTGFYFETLTGTSPNPKPKPSKYGWLFDRTRSYCEDDGCLNGSPMANPGIDRLGGYWTNSTVYGNSTKAWFVGHEGNINTYTLSTSPASFGIRPVITVQKSLLNELD